jgi:hypothetical protein
MTIRIEHRVGVLAPADRVWEVVSHLEHWHGWNPAYPEAAGKISIGGALTLTEALPHLEPVTITPTVVDWVPNEQLLWRLKEGPFASRLHYFEIEPLSEQGSIFAVGVLIDGFGKRALARKKGRSLKLGLGLLAEALKAKVEGA